MKKLLHKIWITFKGFMVSLLPIAYCGAAILICTRISHQNPWWAIWYFILAIICLVTGTVSAYRIGKMFNQTIEEDEDD